MQYFGPKIMYFNVFTVCLKYQNKIKLLIKPSYKCEDMLHVGNMCYVNGISIFPISVRVFHVMVKYEKSYDIVIPKVLVVCRMDTYTHSTQPQEI